MSLSSVIGRMNGEGGEDESSDVRHDRSPTPQSHSFDPAGSRSRGGKKISDGLALIQDPTLTAQGIIDPKRANIDVVVLIPALLHALALLPVPLQRCVIILTILSLLLYSRFNNSLNACLAQRHLQILPSSYKSCADNNKS